MLIDAKTKMGNLAELKVATHYAERGCSVFMPWGGKSINDLIIEDANGRAIRVQVKCTSTMSKNGKGWNAQLKSVRSNKTKNVIKNFDGSTSDILAIYIEPEDRLVFLSAKEYDGRSGVTIAANMERCQSG